MLKQKLQQKILQKLSPQQIQLIKLLEIPTLQFEQRVKKEIEENPALEEAENESNDDLQYEKSEIDHDDSSDTEDDYNSEDEFSIEDYLPDDDDIPEYRLTANNYSRDDEQREIPYSGGITFHENLITQLRLKRNLSHERRELAEYLIGNIDEDGYLRRKLSSIVDDLVFTMNIRTTEDELYQALKAVHELDPAGVGARNLQECLLLQIERQDTSKPEVAIADKILRNHFNEFTRKHYDKIMSRLSIDEEELKESIDEILRLNPKPGTSFTDPTIRDTSTIIPDFILETEDGELTVSMNSRNVPDLRVSRTYIEMLEEYSNSKNKTRSDKETIAFVKQKLDSARWFIDAIKQRQDTLLLTMEAILGYQREYFLTGDERKLRPMILKDIADITGLDISTISRVANSKYIQTEYGILSLKSFFSESMTTDSGEEVSTREIKQYLQECIDNENKRKPLTDEKLTQLLCDKGYNIARRTVAKYREQLNIPVARLRKEI
ncbi:MAG TPA: RNA polymerase factor sigma-54 [Salinivirgaceae bacterium]|nr:RNA polymerase factor sigma-54 [Salinivirgaceae bacterium]HQA76287.1 RNA polymerase factor sigma-54 [Salinivirgaceae bacterium]